VSAATLDHRIPHCPGLFSLGTKWAKCAMCGARYDRHGPEVEAHIMADVHARGISAIQSDPHAREAFRYLRSCGVGVRQYEYAMRFTRV
jgi:hypothetical protein